METIGITTIVVVARPSTRVPGLPQLRVKTSERLRCSFSKDSNKAPSGLTLPPAVLKGMGLRRSWRPWDEELVDEQMSTESTPIMWCAGLPQLGVKMAERLRGGLSKDGKKAPSDVTVSPAVLKGMGLRRSWRPWGPKLVDDQMSPECRTLRLLLMVLNPDWILWCVVGLIYVHPLRRRNDDHNKSGGLAR